MSLVRLFAIAALLLSPNLALAQANSGANSGAKSGIDKLYILNCGEGTAADKSRWTPGENTGVAMDVVDNCYLIHHATKGYMLWDTGVTDAIAGRPPGPPPANGATAWRKPVTLAAQLDALGVTPADIKYVAISHTHPDHIGNVEMFPQSMLLVQKAEYDWPSPLGVGRFKPDHPVTKLEGDHDVVEALYARIQNDPRHTNNRLLFRGAVADREFAQWSMAFINVRRDLTPDGFVDYHAELEQALVDGSRARRVLKMFRDGSWRQAATAAL